MRSMFVLLKERERTHYNLFVTWLANTIPIRHKGSALSRKAASYNIVLSKSRPLKRSANQISATKMKPKTATLYCVCS